MNRALSLLSLAAGLAALIAATLERQAPGRLPIATLIRDRFTGPRLAPVLLGLTCGSLTILGPLAVAVGLGWARLQAVSPLFGGGVLLCLTTILVKAVWAAMEELIYRGALLPQLARLSNGATALVASAILFAFGHLGRGAGGTPDLTSLLVYTLDGLGFGLAWLATRNLWMPALWHLARNLWIWLLFSESTLQLTPGAFRITYDGPPLWVGAASQAGWLDVAGSGLLVLLLAVAWRRRIGEGLRWVASQ